jgi:hypothetical protein
MTAALSFLMVDESGILPRSSTEAVAAQPRHASRIGDGHADSAAPPCAANRTFFALRVIVGLGFQPPTDDETVAAEPRHVSRIGGTSVFRKSHSSSHSCDRRIGILPRSTIKRPRRSRDAFFLLVIPAQAGNHFRLVCLPVVPSKSKWMPAFAGMTAFWPRYSVRTA